MQQENATPVCVKCGAPAVIRLEYCHSDFCASCFSLNFEQKVARAVREFKLLQKGDMVAVGVSGGKDSGALLFALQKLSEKMGGITLKAVLVDEGIEGYRNKAAECAEQLCERLGMKLERISYSQAF